MLNKKIFQTFIYSVPCPEAVINNPQVRHFIKQFMCIVISHRFTQPLVYRNFSAVRVRHFRILFDGWIHKNKFVALIHSNYDQPNHNQPLLASD